MSPAMPYKRLTAAEAEALLAHPQLRLLDVRDAQSHARARIAGATHFGAADLDAAVRAQNKQQPILVYCHRGVASQTYARTLADFGHREVYDLIGGYEAWCAHQAAKTARVAPSARLSEALAAWLAAHRFPQDDLGATSANRNTALMRACQLGETALAAEMIALGAPLQVTNGDGNNALWQACYSGKPELVALLIGSGVEIDRRNDHGATCLMYAASSGKAEVVRALLDGGADLALTSPDDLTALDMAANLACLRLLVNATRGRGRAPAPAAGAGAQ